MKNKQWIFEVVLFILWTTAFVATLISGNIRVIDYVVMYLALFIELLKNFLNSYWANKENNTKIKEDNDEH